MADIHHGGGSSSKSLSTLPRRTLSQNVKRLQETLNVLFNSDDRAMFIRSLNEYHRHRDVYDFVHSLKYLLDTTAKQHMIPLLRKVIPQSDVGLFDKYVLEEELYPMELRARLSRSMPALNSSSSPSTSSFPASRMSRPPHRSEANGLADRPAQRSLGSPDPSAVVVKHVRLRKCPEGGLGFSIRGGAEHGIGIYVSYVDQDSIAEQQGLMPGDQLVTVNDVSFQKITPDEAAKVSCTRNKGIAGDKRWGEGESHPHKRGLIKGLVMEATT